MKVVAVVPIKLENERLPGKNIKKFDNGEPLCTYILNTLLSISQISEVYVYCSDVSIKSYLPKSVKFLKRMPSLDSAQTSMNEILSRFSLDVEADYYILSHATSPFVRKQSIEEALEKVLGGEFDSALSVEVVRKFMWNNGQVANYNPVKIPRTQDLDPIYIETSGFYIFSRDLIHSEGRRVGRNPFLKQVSKIEAVDIDDIEDFEMANAIFNVIKIDYSKIE